MACEDTQTPTTEIQAINVMLSMIGQTPVSTLTAPQSIEVELAQDLLCDVSREIQTNGWHFNTEINRELVPNVAKEIVVAANVVRVTVMGIGVQTTQLRHVDVTLRGSRLYNRETNSFDEFESSLFVEQVVILPFEELPETARRYFLIRAGRQFSERFQAENLASRWTRDDEQFARKQFMKYEGRVAQRTFLDSPDMAGYMIRRPRG